MVRIFEWRSQEMNWSTETDDGRGVDVFWCEQHTPICATRSRQTTFIYLFYVAGSSTRRASASIRSGNLFLFRLK